jgi:hypothetical protein
MTDDLRSELSPRAMQSLCDGAGAIRDPPRRESNTDTNLPALRVPSGDTSMARRRVLPMPPDPKMLVTFDLKVSTLVKSLRSESEWFMGTVRSECVDHLLVVIALHREGIPWSFTQHYNCPSPALELSQGISEPQKPSCAVWNPPPVPRASTRPPRRVSPRIGVDSVRVTSSFRTIRT